MALSPPAAVIAQVIPASLQVPVYVIPFPADALTDVPISATLITTVALVAPEAVAVTEVTYVLEMVVGKPKDACVIPFAKLCSLQARAKAVRAGAETPTASDTFAFTV